jgi:hypothetical protein
LGDEPALCRAQRLAWTRVDPKRRTAQTRADDHDWRGRYATIVICEVRWP